MPLVTEKFEIPYANLHLQRPPCWLHIEEFLFNTWGAVRKHFWGCMRHAGKENLVLPSWFLLLCCIQPFLVSLRCEAKPIYTGRTGDSLLAFIFSSSHVGWNCFYKLTCSNLGLCFPKRSLISMEMSMGHSLCWAAIWIPCVCASWGKVEVPNGTALIIRRKWPSRNNMISCHGSCRDRWLKINEKRNTINFHSSGNFLFWGKSLIFCLNKTTLFLFLFSAFWFLCLVLSGRFN